MPRRGGGRSAGAAGGGGGRTGGFGARGPGGGGVAAGGQRERRAVPKIERVISRPMTVPAERTIDLKALDFTTCSTILGSSFAGRGARAGPAASAAGGGGS